MDFENSTYGRSSQLRQPSKLHSPTKGLSETTDSANNARATTMMPPPGTISLKHKTSGLPEPAPKRKTLAERAGEAPRMNSAAPSYARPPSSALKTTGMAAPRNPSFSSSVSSNASRHKSNNSFSKSIGLQGRPPSAQSRARPQSVISHPRSMSQTPVPAARPASSLEASSTESQQASGKRKGMTPILLYPKHRQARSQSKREVATVQSIRDGASPEDSSRARGGTGKEPLRTSPRSVSLDAAMCCLSLSSTQAPSQSASTPQCCTPSHIPKPVPPSPLTSPSPSNRSLHLKRNRSPNKLPFLTRESRTQAWDTKGRLEDMEHLYSELREQMSGASTERKDLQDHIEIYKARITELEALRTHLTAENTRLQTELSTTSLRLTTATTAREDERRSYRNELDDMKSRHRDDLDSRRRQAQEETEQLLKSHRVIVEGLERRLKVEIEDERNRRQRDLQEATTQSALDKQRAAVEADVKEMEISGVKRDLTQMQEDLEREKVTGRNLRDNLSEVTSSNVSLESSMRALKAKIEFLESDSQSQAKSFTDLDKQLQDALDAAKEAQEKLRKEETLRRILHNQVQELKGNVRVFCRVRPSLSIDSEEAANILFPDAGKEAKEVEILGAEEKSSLGTITRKKNAFAFDRIFAPNTQNQEVFDEISQLVQSALDGYNVCIFCYGQTGSGKTYTMSAEDGMIPRAVTQIYETAQTLQDKGWSYTMEGSFLEVYNETLNDLLGRAEDFDKKKLEIRHDLAKGRTTVSDLTSVILDTPTKVESLLRRAAANRSVAATKANERSSRSHSVFILRLVGVNRSTGERSEGTLNLVDLAGSERLSQSGATGDRLKETQNINRSLSCLGDVIGALGQGKEGGHVPYRNSKLTYLLQHSLGGNSKTLMFVMISPLQAHLGETLTSLKFATKVHNTHIGTAKRQAKVKE